MQSTRRTSQTRVLKCLSVQLPLIVARQIPDVQELYVSRIDEGCGRVLTLDDLQGTWHRSYIETGGSMGAMH